MSDSHQFRVSLIVGLSVHTKQLSFLQYSESSASYRDLRTYLIANLQFYSVVKREIVAQYRPDQLGAVASWKLFLTPRLDSSSNLSVVCKVYFLLQESARVG